MSFGFMGCRPSQTWEPEARVIPDPDDSNSTITVRVAPEAPKVGTIGQAGSDQYQVVQAAEAITAFACCFITGEGKIRELSTQDIDPEAFPLCIPQVALAEHEIGWGLVEGTGKVLALVNAAANAQLYTTTNQGGSAVPGALDDTATVGAIVGIQLTAAAPAAFPADHDGGIACWVSRPHVTLNESG